MSSFASLATGETYLLLLAMYKQARVKTMPFISVVSGQWSLLVRVDVHGLEHRGCLFASTGHVQARVSLHRHFFLCVSCLFVVNYGRSITLQRVRQEGGERVSVSIEVEKLDIYFFG